MTQHMKSMQFGLEPTAPSSLSQAREFLSRVLPWDTDAAAWIGIHYTYNAEQGDKGWAGRAVMKLDEAVAAVDRLVSGAGLDIYACMSSQREVEEKFSKAGGKYYKAVRNQKNAVALKSLFLDIDCKGGGDSYESQEEAIAALDQFVQRSGMPEPSVLLYSGSGLHVHWVLTSSVALENWQPLADALAEAARQCGLRCDRAVTTDSARILRIPGTFNHKTQPSRPVSLRYPIGADHPLERISSALSRFEPTSRSTLARSPRAIHTLPLKAPLEGVSPLAAGIGPTVEEIRSAVDAIPPSAITAEADWVKLARGLAHTANTNPHQADALWDILDAASQRAPGYNAAENHARWGRYVREALDRDAPIKIATVFKIAQDHGWQGMPAQPVTSLGNLLPVGQSPVSGSGVSFANVPHRQWLYGMDLVRGEITILASPGGVGKSSLAVGMAVAIATGRPLLTEKIYGNELTALYINAEDSVVEMTRRLWAFCLNHGVAEQDISRLRLLGTDSHQVERLSFLTTQGSTSMLDEPGIAQFETLLNALRPDFVVLDPVVALCGGGSLNDNSAMSLVMRRLKRLAGTYNCALMLVHHTRKGGDLSNAEAIGGASAIVNLARRALMAVPMVDDEATKLGVLPSERQSYLKVVPSKSNLAPRSADLPWYHLCNVTLPNSEPPIYMHGDSVQAIERVTLPKVSSASTVETLRIKRAILDVADAGKIIDGQAVPYSPVQTGASNQRSILEDAMVAVEQVTGRPWNQEDLRAVVQRTLDDLRGAGWIVTEKIKNHPRFRRTQGLRVDWQQTPWPAGRNQRDTTEKTSPPANISSSDGTSKVSAEMGNGQSGAIAQSIDSPMTNVGVVVNCPPFKGALTPHHPEAADPPPEPCKKDEGDTNADT